jgi:hypothetical protein
VGRAGEAREHPLELSQNLCGPELVQVVDHQHNGLSPAAKAGEHPIDQVVGVEPSGAAGLLAPLAGRRLAERVEHRAPEQLLPSPLVLHRHERDVMFTAARPGAQQRRLSAPGRRRDDRDLLCEEPAEVGLKLGSLEQPFPRRGQLQLRRRRLGTLHTVRSNDCLTSRKSI